MQCLKTFAYTVSEGKKQKSFCQSHQTDGRTHVITWTHFYMSKKINIYITLKKIQRQK